MKNTELKNYFLGLMSAKDAETVELRIISVDGIESELLQAENDLIEEYLDGKLVNDELKAFNDNFLITQERKERVEFVRLMRGYADKQPIESEPKPSFFEQLKAFAAIRPLTFASALLALILCIGIAWQIGFRTNVNITETELVGLNKQDLSNLDEFKSLKSLNLTSGALRSGGNTSSLPEKDLTDRFLVRLILPNKVDSVKNFNVKISKDGQVLSNLTQRNYDREVRLLLPKVSFTKGEYQITLEKDGEKYNFYFAVQK
jgi:hypothetical protein